jgi:hypothetical protein
MVNVDIVYAVVLGFLCFAIYYSTMYRSLAGGDSGDFVACSCNLGVAHPPGREPNVSTGQLCIPDLQFVDVAGYPLFTMLGAVFIRIVPWGKFNRILCLVYSEWTDSDEHTGSPAFRVNLVAVICSAMTGSVMYLMIMKWLAPFNKEPRRNGDLAALRWSAAIAVTMFAFCRLVKIHACKPKPYPRKSYRASEAAEWGLRE